MAKISQINDVVNTTTSVKNNGKSEAQIQKAMLNTMQNTSLGPKKKFKCSSIYAAYYPDGFISTYQLRPIYLVFDNSVVELPEKIVEFVEQKIQNKADREAEKAYRFKTKKQEKLDSIEVE